MYCCTVWNPYLKRDVENVSMKQHFGSADKDKTNKNTSSDSILKIIDHVIPKVGRTILGLVD